MTFPKMMELMRSGETLADSRAALEAAKPRSVAETFFSFPPYVPNAVRFAATINTPETAARKKNTLYNNRQLLHSGSNFLQLRISMLACSHYLRHFMPFRSVMPVLFETESVCVISLFIETKVNDNDMTRHKIQYC
jgi:hypothetical protein